MKANSLLNKFSKLNVLIVGDVMLDRYMTGRVGRISPEAPVPVVEWAGEENRLGGAANVALNVKALDATPWLCGVVGKDLDGGHFFEELAKNQLFGEGILFSETRKTTVKTRVIAGTQHLLRLDKEDRHDLNATEQKAFLAKVFALLDAHDFQVIILQDYNKGVLSKTVIHRLLAAAKERKIPVAVDPKSRNFWEYKNVALFKPNLKEVRDALPMAIVAEEKSLRNASEYIRKKLRNHFTLITLSEKGAYLDEASGGKLYPTQPRKVADVCGAGDTVISAAALGLAAGLPASEIAVLTNLAGGQVVEKTGVVSVDRTQLEEELKAFGRW